MGPVGACMHAAAALGTARGGAARIWLGGIPAPDPVYQGAILWAMLSGAYGVVTGLSPATAAHRQHQREACGGNGRAHLCMA